MPRPVDEQIVKMTLDDRDFKSKASGVVGIFGKLSQAMGKLKGVNFKDSTNSLGELQQTADRTNLGKLIDGAKNATSNFSALGVMAVTTLMNITNRAVDAGIKMAKAFTVDPIMDGFGEYELKMKSIQTIMSNTQGKSTLEDVTKVLDTLNTYADKTIYNFADMTSNIGTFTAAGVDLEKSAIAIQGIANLAAASGSNTQQASTAMYQLSQALATGNVKLQDWNSVVNAGMGGKLFQNALIKTADNMGIAHTASENFRESLQEGWLTTDVLIATLNEFAEDESMLEAATKVRTFTQLVDTAKEAVGSGWAQTWEIIVGDFEEAGKMWSAVNDVISGPIEASAEARNKLLQDFVDLGGKKQIIDSVKNTFQSLTKVIGIVQSAFRDVFPPVTARNLMDIANNIKIFTERLKLSEESAAKFKTIFTGVFTVLRMGVDIVKMTARAIGAIIPDRMGGRLLNFLTSIAEMIIAFEEWFSASKLINSSFEGISITANGVADAVGKVLTFFKDLFDNVYSTMRKAASAMKPFINAISQEVQEVLGSFTTNDLIGGGILAILYAAFQKFKGVGDLIGEALEGVVDALESASGSFSVFEDLGDSLQAFTGSVKAASLLAIASAIGILAISMKVIETIDAEDIAKGLFTIATTLTMLTSSLRVISQQSGSVSNTIQAVSVISALSGAILILSGAMKIIATMSLKELGKGLIGLAGILVTLTASLNSMARNSGRMSASAIGILAVSTAVVILSQAVKQLSKLNKKELAKGVGSVGAILLELALFMKIVNGSKLNMSSALSLAAISGTILVMVEAIRQIGDIDTNVLVIGLGTIGAILLEFAIFSKLASGSRVISAATSMVIVAQAIKMLIGPIEELGKMDLETLAQGLISMTTALGLIVGAMTLARGSLAGATSILVVAGAINALVAPIEALGKMSIKQLAKALGTLAISFTTIGIAAKVIGIQGSVVLLAFAAALGAVSIAALAITAALVGFGAGLTVLATLTGATIGAIMTSLGLLIKGFTDLLPLVGDLMIEIINTMARVMVEGLPTLFDAGWTLILELARGMKENLPELYDLGTDIVIGMMTKISEKAPELAESGTKMTITLMQSIADAIRENHDDIIKAGMELTASLLLIMVDGFIAIVNATLGSIPGVKEATNEMGFQAQKALAEQFGIDITGELGRGAGQGFADGVISKETEVKRAAQTIAEGGRAVGGSVSYTEIGAKAGAQYGTALSGTKNFAFNSASAMATKAREGAGRVSFNKPGTVAGAEYALGIYSQQNTSRNRGAGLGTSARSGAASVSLHGTGGNLGQGFANGITSKSWTVVSAAQGLANLARGAVEKVLAIFSPSRVMIQDGQFFGEGFGIGITNQYGYVKDKASEMATNAMVAVKSVTSRINDAIFENLDSNPEITPVVNLDNLSGFDMRDTFDITGTSEILTSMQANRTTKSLDPVVASMNPTVITHTDNGMQKVISSLIDKVDRISDRAIVVENAIDGRVFANSTAKYIKPALTTIDNHMNIIKTGGVNRK